MRYTVSLFLLQIIYVIGDVSTMTSFCNNTWIKILQTDGAGNIESGNKSALIDAVLNGALLQVYVPAWDYVTSIQQMELAGNDTELCAQAILHIGKDSWETFADDAYWYFLTFCSNGYISRAQWLVGTHAQPLTFNITLHATLRQRIVWFVRFIDDALGTGNPIYCNSYDGTKTCGNMSKFIDGIQNGFDIRAVTKFDSKIVMPFNHLETSKINDMIAGKSVWSILGAYGHGEEYMTFNKGGYWWFTDWSTDGVAQMSQWSIGNHVYIGCDSIHFPMNWFVDTCWILAYKHDEAGHKIDGSIELLRSKLQQGHRIKLIMGNYSIEADNLVLQNGHVSAQLLGHVFLQANDTFQPNGYWYWNHVSTSGEGETIRYDIGSTTNEGSSNYTTGVSWITDTRQWKHVLSTSQLGIATFGTKPELIRYLRSGFMLRCVIHFSKNHILAAQADNVEFSPDGTNVGAQILRVVSYTTDDPNIRHFENVPYWKFIIVTTEGSVHFSEWVVGEHKSRVTDLFVADVDWFVN